MRGERDRPLFLPDDLSQLDSRIQRLSDRYRALGREMGESCREGAETWHDNFAYEEGERQQRMLARRLAELVEVRKRALVVQPVKSEAVSIGSRVRLLDLGSGEERVLRIGSFLCFEEGEGISYQAPLARLLIGAQAGEVREGLVAGTEKCLEIVEVH